MSEVLVEQRADIARELYAAVLNDSESAGPLLVFSTRGGMDIEAVNSATPELVRRLPVDIRAGLDAGAVAALLADTDLDEPDRRPVADALMRLYAIYRDVDAQLVEINPLVVNTSGEIIALDAKVSLDPGALPRQAGLVETLVEQLPDTSTPLERRGRDLGLSYIELDGSVGVLANGAGLTMTTLDAVNHFGGRPANFLEIGGDAYTKATAALELVLANPSVRSLVINFCGAFARTDVMTDGVVTALEQLRPEIPIFFTVHGTGEVEAIRLIRDRLGYEPFDRMDDAVRAAVDAATTEVSAR